MDPANFKFAKTHEWAHVDGDVATVGISDFAVGQLTDLVYIDLPEVGRSLSAGEAFGEVESVKAVAFLLIEKVELLIVVEVGADEGVTALDVAGEVG